MNKVIVEVILPTSFWGRTKYKFIEKYTHDGIVVDKELVTDGASTFRLLWWLFPPVGRYFVAAAYHDKLVRNKVVSRDSADVRFYVALKKLGINKVVVNTLYIGARIGTLVKRYTGIDLGMGSSK